MSFLRVFLCLAVGPALSAATASKPAATPPGPPPVPTVIESGRAEMISTDKETTFTFEKNVSVTGTNIQITCDRLVVVARRAGDPAATLGKQENFKSLLATGNVRILQEDREATAARAEVFPDDDKVVLSGNPSVRSEKEGWTQTAPGMDLELHRGQRRAVIAGPEGTRVRIALPAMKDLGPGKAKDAKQSDTPAESSAAPSPKQ